MMFNVDARHGLSVLADESVDMVFTDPPYKTISGGNTTKHRRCSGMLAENNGKGGFEHNSIEPHEYAADLYRVLKSPGHAWVMTNELNRRKIEDARHWLQASLLASGPTSK